jgi:hypothetical protein
MSDMADDTHKRFVDRCAAILSACGIAVSIVFVLLSYIATSPSRELKIGLWVMYGGLIPVVIQFVRRLRPWKQWTIEKGVQEHTRELRQFYPRWARLLEWVIYTYPVLLLVQGIVDPSAQVSRSPETAQERIPGLRLAAAITLALYYHMGIVFFFVPRDAKPVDSATRDVKRG